MPTPHKGKRDGFSFNYELIPLYFYQILHILILYMNFYLSLPLLFLKFWFYDAPKSILGYCGSMNNAFFQLFSLPLLLQTYFKPWKNEYRKNLVAVAIGLGIFIKTFVILADLIIFLLLLAVEISFVAVFIAWPLATIYMLFMK